MAPCSRPRRAGGGPHPQHPGPLRCDVHRVARRGVRRRRPGMTVAVVGDGAVGVRGVGGGAAGRGHLIAMSRHADSSGGGPGVRRDAIVAERDEAGLAQVRALTTASARTRAGVCRYRASPAQAVAYARPGGMIGLVGVPHGDLPTDELFWANKGVRGGPAPVRAYLPHLLDLVWNRRVIDPGKVFDLTLPLAEVAEAYRVMDERRAIKVLLQKPSRVGAVPAGQRGPASTWNDRHCHTAPNAGSVEVTARGQSTRPRGPPTPQRWDNPRASNIHVRRRRRAGRERPRPDAAAADRRDGAGGARLHLRQRPAPLPLDAGLGRGQPDGPRVHRRRRGDRRRRRHREARRPGHRAVRLVRQHLRLLPRGPAHLLPHGGFWGGNGIGGGQAEAVRVPAGRRHPRQGPGRRGLRPAAVAADPVRRATAPATTPPSRPA